MALNSTLPGALDPEMGGGGGGMRAGGGGAAPRIIPPSGNYPIEPPSGSPANNVVRFIRPGSPGGRSPTVSPAIEPPAVPRTIAPRPPVEIPAQPALTPAIPSASSPVVRAPTAPKVSPTSPSDSQPPSKVKPSPFQADQAVPYRVTTIVVFGVSEGGSHGASSVDDHVVVGPILGTIVEPGAGGAGGALILLSGDESNPTRTGLGGGANLAGGGIVSILRLSDDIQVFQSPNPDNPDTRPQPKRLPLPLAFPSAPQLPQFLPFADPAPLALPIPIAPRIAPLPTIDPASPVPLRDPLAPAYPQKQPVRSPVPLIPILPSPAGAPAGSPAGAPAGSPAGAPDANPYAVPHFADPTADPQGGTPTPTPPDQPKDPLDCCAELLAGQAILGAMIRQIKPPVDCCDEIIRAISEVKSNLEQTVSFSITSFDDKCENRTYTSNDKGIAGLKKQIDQLARMLADEKKHACDNPAIAAIPEWWQVRLGANYPQLVLQFGQDLGNGKRGAPDSVLTIPHFNPAISLVSGCPIQGFSKGNWEGILTLADNSKVIVNAITADEAERVIELAKGMILPSMLVGSFLKLGQRKGQALRQITVKARIAKYFATGQKNMKPNWVRYFNE
jgi:hypothetical protein